MALRFAVDTRANRARRATGSSAFRITIVDRAIAVVIDAITQLGGRLNVLLTFDATRRACRHAIFTWPRLAGIADFAAARIAFIHQTITVIVFVIAQFGNVEAPVIDDVVAIVVFAVAEFALRFDLPQTGPPLPFDTLLLTRFAFRTHAIFRLQFFAVDAIYAVVTLLLRAFGANESIVRSTITIVVRTVPCFGPRNDIAIAFVPCPVSFALLRSTATNTNPLGIIGTAITRLGRHAGRTLAIFIDFAIAIVVPPVTTNLRIGKDLAIANRPSPSGANLAPALHAEAKTPLVGRAIVTLLGLSLVARTHLVDTAIAVVIDAVFANLLIPRRPLDTLGRQAVYATLVFVQKDVTSTETTLLRFNRLVRTWIGIVLRINPQNIGAAPNQPQAQQHHGPVLQSRFAHHRTPIFDAAIHEPSANPLTPPGDILALIHQAFRHSKADHAATREAKRTTKKGKRSTVALRISDPRPPYQERDKLLSSLRILELVTWTTVSRPVNPSCLVPSTPSNCSPMPLRSAIACPMISSRRRANIFSSNDP